MVACQALVSGLTLGASQKRTERSNGHARDHPSTPGVII
jgi:hypothetical protein